MPSSPLIWDIGNPKPKLAQIYRKHISVACTKPRMILNTVHQNRVWTFFYHHMGVIVYWGPNTKVVQNYLEHIYVKKYSVFVKRNVVPYRFHIFYSPFPQSSRFCFCLPGARFLHQELILYLEVKLTKMATKIMVTHTQNVTKSDVTRHNVGKHSCKRLLLPFYPKILGRQWGPTNDILWVVFS